MIFQDILTKTYYNNTAEQWLITFGIILGAVIVGRFLYWICGNVIKALTNKTKSKLDDIIIDMIEEPIVFAIVIAAGWYAFSRLTFSEEAAKFVWNVFDVLIIINIAWLITRLFDAIVKEYLTPLAEKSETDLDDQLLPIVRKGVKVIVWIVAIIIALNNAGYNVGALLAGLGIGGIAFAMAAKDTLANMFGGFTIFTDKPFKLKDRIKINGFDGVVTEIGLRSTRLQTFDGTMISMPNAKFAESAIENISMEPSRRVVMNLGLVYSTTPSKMEKAMEILREIPKKVPSITEEVKVSFTEFADSSMNILFIYYIKKGEDILAAKTDVNMHILKEFNKNKLDFAFPTRTIYNMKG